MRWVERIESKLLMDNFFIAKTFRWLRDKENNRMRYDTAKQKIPTPWLWAKKLKLERWDVLLKTGGSLTALVWQDTREVYMLTNINPPPGEGTFATAAATLWSLTSWNGINWHMAYVDSSDRMASSYSMCRRTFKCKAAFPRAVFSSAARHTLVQMDVFPRACAAISAALLSRSWRC